MAGRNVGNLVRHHACKLSLFVGRQNQSAVHVEETARQSEGVDLVRVDDLDSERHLGVGVAHQVLPDSIHVLIDDRVLNHAGGLFDHHGVLLAHLDFGVGRVPIAQAAAANLAIADRVYVVLAARLHAGAWRPVCLQAYRSKRKGSQSPLPGSCWSWDRWLPEEWSRQVSARPIGPWPARSGRSKATMQIEAETARAFMGTPVPERILTIVGCHHAAGDPLPTQRRSCACSEAPVAEEPLRWATLYAQSRMSTAVPASPAHIHPVDLPVTNPRWFVSCCAGPP